MDSNQSVNQVHGEAAVKYYVTAVPLIPNSPLPIAHVNLTAHGSVQISVSGNAFDYPYADAKLIYDGRTLGSVSVGGPRRDTDGFSDSFSITGHDAHPLTFFPNQQYEVDLIAFASATALNPYAPAPGRGFEILPLSEYARAEVDPLFELDPADAPYFELQFSPNLSEPPPTEVPEPSTQSVVAVGAVAILLTRGFKSHRGSKWFGSAVKMVISRSETGVENG